MYMTETFKQELVELAWWIKIITNQPNCTYYFGLFDCQLDAQFYLPEYVENLLAEGVKGINIKIEYCQPEKLTIDVETPHSKQTKILW